MPITLTEILFHTLEWMFQNYLILSFLDIFSSVFSSIDKMQRMTGNFLCAIFEMSNLCKKMGHKTVNANMFILETYCKIVFRKEEECSFLILLWPKYDWLYHFLVCSGKAWAVNRFNVWFSKWKMVLWYFF